MNTYILKSLANIKNRLQSIDSASDELVDSVIGEIEMIKMEIEQHIQNMPDTDNYSAMKISAEDAVSNLSEILDLFEELTDSDITDQTNIISEIIELIDLINY